MKLHLATSISILFLALVSHAFGLAGDLDKPSLSFPKDFKSEQMISVISDKQFKFLGGHFINANSTLTYAGDAASLNSFLTRLADCKGAKVSVAFSKGEGDMSWTLQHNAWGDPNAFYIAVNTARIAESAVKLPK